MKDLAKIKRNVAKMASQNAPEEDIDGYIASEGATIDEIRSFKEPSVVKGVFGDVLAQAYAEGERNFLGNITDRPAAATRAYIGAVIKGKDPALSYEQAAINPSVAPQKYSESFANKAMDVVPSDRPILGGIAGTAGAIAGTVADVATDPLQTLLAGASTLKPVVSATEQIGASLMKTPAGKILQTNIVEIPTKANKFLTGIGEAITSAQEKIWGTHKYKEVASELKDIAKNIKSEAPISALGEELSYKLSEGVQSAEKLLKKNHEWLNKAIEGHVETTRSELPALSKRASTSYGEALEKIFDKIQSKSSYISNGDAATFAGNVLDDISHLPPSNIQSALQRLQNKYLNPDMSPMGKVDLERFYSEIRELSKVGNKYGYTPDDLAGLHLKSKLADFLENKVEGLKALNSAYRPTIESIKESNKIFRPWDNTYASRRQGISFMKQVAEETLQGQQNDLVDIIEKGTKFTKTGVTKFSTSLKERGRQIKSIQSQIDKMTKDFSDTAHKVKILNAEQADIEKKRKAVIGALTAFGVTGGAIAGGKSVGKVINEFGGR